MTQEETITPHETPATIASPTEPPPVTPREAGVPRDPDAHDKTSPALPIAVLSLIGVVALAFFVGWTALQPQPADNDPARIAALEQQANALSGQVKQIEQKPAPAAPDLGPMQQRLTALEQKPAPALPDLGPLDQRLSALEHKPAPPVIDLSPLEQRVAELEKRANAPSQSASKGDLADLAGRVDQQTARQDALGSHEQADVASLTARLDALDAKLQGDAKLEGQIGSLAAKQAGEAKLQAASAALNAGQKLGDLPGAPPALQRFADTTPPTEASLRLSFDQAARSTQLASTPSVEDKPFLDRVWARAQQSVTVRQGDRVLIGDPIAGVLEHSKQALDAGDLAGSVAVLNQLAGPAAAAMAPWKTSAQSLLDARAALLTMAHS